MGSADFSIFSRMLGGGRTGALRLIGPEPLGFDGAGTQTGSVVSTISIGDRSATAASSSLAGPMILSWSIDCS